MNILHLTTHLNSGGITSYLLSLIPEQKKIGSHVYVWGASGDRLKDFQMTADEVYDTVPRTKSELSPKVWLALPGLLTILKEQSIHMIHAHTRVTQVLAEVASRISGVPFVTTAHGFYKMRIGRKLFPCWGRAVFAISEAVRDGLMNTFDVGSLPMIRVVPNGIDIAGIQEKMKHLNRTEVRRDYGFRNEDVVILSLSRLRPSKGVHFLISAFKMAVSYQPNLKLLIVGGGDEAYRKELERQVEIGGVQNSVIFAGSVSEIERPLKSADIFVAPNLSPEGFGLSILEAMAAGLPIVATKTQGAMELLKQGDLGLLVREADPSDLAGALQSYAKDRDLREKMAKKAFWASDNYSASLVAESIQEVYEHVMRVA